MPSLDPSLAAYEAAAKAIAKADDLGAAVDGVLRGLLSTLRWDVGIGWVVDRPGSIRCLSVVHAGENPFEAFTAGSHGRTFAFGDGLPGRVAQSAGAEWIEDIRRDARFPRAGEAMADGLRSGVAFPVCLTGEVLSVLEVFSTESRPADEAQLRLLESISSLLGLFIRRVRDREELVRSEARMRAMVDSSLDALLSTDVLGNVVEFNQAAERMFGYTRAQAMGRNMGDLIVPPEFRAAHQAGHDRVAAGGQERVANRRLELTAMRADGTRFPVELTITRVHAKNWGPGEPLYTGFMRDITARQELEKQNERLYREAQEANRLKDEFLATLSHELRTPLNAILGWAHMLRTGALDEAGRTKALEIVDRNARLQAQLVNDVLDVSRIVTGKLRLDVQDVDPAKIIASSLETIRLAAEGKRIRVEVKLDPLTGSIQGDPARLQQVVWNLVSNAIKFTEVGGRVEIAMRRTGDTVEIRVSDSGKGIEPEFLPLVFERFRQGDSTATREHGGLGLGLAIVRHLVEIHGGTVSAESEGRGKGSTFIVRLPASGPAAVAEALSAPPVAEPPGESAVPRLEGLFALVVDDQEDARVLIAMILRQAGARVETAPSANAALAALSRAKHGILVSDIGMPGADGYSLIRAIRASSDGMRGMPALALTAYARVDDRVLALREGFNEHLSKPVDPATLLRTVAGLTGRA